MVEQWSRQMIDLYTAYKNKLLPFAGGLYDQPNAYHIAMNIIDNYINKEE